MRQQLEGRGGGFVFPGPNRAVGGAGPGPGRELKGRGASMGEGVGPGRPWAALGAGRICGGLAGPGPGVQAGGMTVIGVPNPQRGPVLSSP